MLEYVKRNSKQHGDIMETEFKRLTEDEYRKFEAWIRENGKELYENKIAYEVRWGKDDDTYTVRLCDESSYTLNEIMLDIHQNLV